MQFKDPQNINYLWSTTQIQVPSSLSRSLSVILRFIELPLLPIWTCTLSNWCESVQSVLHNGWDPGSSQYTHSLTDIRDTHIHSHLQNLQSHVQAFRLRAHWKPTKAWEENRPQDVLICQNVSQQTHPGFLEPLPCLHRTAFLCAIHKDLVPALPPLLKGALLDRTEIWSPPYTPQTQI